MKLNYLPFIAGLVTLAIIMTNCQKEVVENCNLRCEKPCLTESRIIDGECVCACNPGTVNMGNNFCLRPNKGIFVAYLPEVDHLDTFALSTALRFVDGPGEFLCGMTAIDDPCSGPGFTATYSQHETMDSIYIDMLPPPDGAFSFMSPPPHYRLSLSAGFQGLDPDTLYARIEWRTLGGKAIREPLDFKMINVR